MGLFWLRSVNNYLEKKYFDIFLGLLSRGNPKHAHTIFNIHLRDIFFVKISNYVFDNILDLFGGPIPMHGGVKGNSFEFIPLQIVIF